MLADELLFGGFVPGGAFERRERFKVGEPVDSERLGRAESKQRGRREYDRERGAWTDGKTMAEEAKVRQAAGAVHDDHMLRVAAGTPTASSAPPRSLLSQSPLEALYSMHAWTREDSRGPSSVTAASFRGLATETGNATAACTSASPFERTR